MQKMIRRILAAVTLLPFFLCAYANDEVLNLTGSDDYWVHPGKNYSNWNYSGLGQINNKNAGKLQVAWTLSTGKSGNHTGGMLVLPAAVTNLPADTLFIHTPYPNDVLAVNLENHKLEWIYDADPEAKPGECCLGRNFGLSYANGKIFLQRNDMNLVAIHVNNGRVAWQTKLTYAIGSQKIINAPYPVNNYLITGTENLDNDGGSITAYRIADGRLMWKAFHNGTVKDVLFSDATTSMGMPVTSDLLTTLRDSMKVRSKYFPWVSIAWDKKENLIYYGSGQADRALTGNQHWTSSIIARDADTGIARWVYKITPSDKWGYSANTEMILADIKIKERQIRALIHFDKNGFVYVLNRITGELVLAEKYDSVVNWATHIDLKNGLPVAVAAEEGGIDGRTKYLCPALTGTKPEQPAAFSPRTGLFYIPASNSCTSVISTNQESEIGVELNVQDSPKEEIEIVPAGAVFNDGTTNMGKVIAWNANAAQVKWTIPEQWPVMSGMLATGGDVVFYGTLDGYVRVVDAKTGSLLWQFKVPSGVVGNFVTWMYKDKQYVGVLTGTMQDPDTIESVYGKLRTSIRAGGTLIVFSLP